MTTEAGFTSTGFVVGVMLALVTVACSGGAGTAATGVTESPEEATSTTDVAPGTTTTEVTTAPAEPVASNQDPCTILTIDEINEVFPGNDEPLSAEGDQCMWEFSWYIDLGPVTLEGLEADEEPTGWEIRQIDIDGADWAVARIDTNVTEYEKVVDLAAGGARGTVGIVVSNADIEWGSPTFDGLVGLLQIALGRL